MLVPWLAFETGSPVIGSVVTMEGSRKNPEKQDITPMEFLMGNIATKITFLDPVSVTKSDQAIYEDIKKQGDPAALKAFCREWGTENVTTPMRAVDLAQAEILDRR